MHQLWTFCTVSTEETEGRLRLFDDIVNCLWQIWMADNMNGAATSNKQGFKCNAYKEKTETCSHQHGEKGTKMLWASSKDNRSKSTTLTSVQSFWQCTATREPHLGFKCLQMWQAKKKTSVKSVARGYHQVLIWRPKKLSEISMFWPFLQLVTWRGQGT